MVNLPPSFAGAVALNPKPAAGSAPAGKSQWVVDVTEATFETEVLDRSMQVPVVMDFWASWCGPCKALSPILERLAEAGRGSWVLAKIDTEANPNLAAAAQIRSIPAVKAMVDGQVVDEFTGAIPEAQVTQWLSRLPLPRGAGGEGAPQADADLDAAAQAIQDGDIDAAEAAFKRAAARNPSDIEVVAGLAGVALMRRVAQRPGADSDEVAKVGFACDMAFLQGRPDMAISEMVDLVKRTSGDERQRARLHLLTYFDALGPGEPLVVQGRKDLTNALF